MDINEIKKLYKKFSLPRRILKSFAMACLIVAVPSYFDLFAKWGLLKCIVVFAPIAIVVGILWAGVIGHKISRLVDSIRTEDCDAEKLLDATKAILEYGEQNKKSKIVYNQTKQCYVIALLVNKKFDEAENYINTQKFPADTITRKRLNTNLQLRRSYDNGDVETYAKVFMDADVMFTKNPLFVSYGFMLDKNYERVIEELLKYDTKTPYEEVLCRFTLAKAYLNLGDRETAKGHLQFVIEKGNTLPCRYEANALYMKNYTEEGEQ